MQAGTVLNGSQFNLNDGDRRLVNFLLKYRLSEDFFFFFRLTSRSKSSSAGMKISQNSLKVIQGETIQENLSDQLFNTFLTELKMPQTEHAVVYLKPDVQVVLIVNFIRVRLNHKKIEYCCLILSFH